MNRYNIYGYNNAWYWRSMYRPYNHRYDSRYSFYFGYNYGSANYYGYDNYNYYDPFYSHAYNSYYYDDFYFPFNTGYAGNFYRPHTHFNQRQIQSGSGNSHKSNQVRKFNRLRRAGSISTVNGSNPSPYYIPLIKPVKTNENNSSRKVTVKKSKNRGTSGTSTRSGSRKSKEVKSSSTKGTKIKSSSHRGRSGKRTVKKSSSSSKGDTGENSKSSKKNSKRK